MKSRLSIFIGLLVIVCNVFAQSQIVANFKSDITAGCSPIVVNFQDLSTGNPAIWKWDFGNGATSTKKNPSATFFDPGLYTVTLIASNANGTITNKKTATITVYLPPVADFSVNNRNFCSPAIVKFTDNSSTPANTPITTWKWDFGDGNSSTAQNPQHIYRSAGSYTVTLTITNNLGCTQLITKPNYVDVSEGILPGFNYSDPAVCSAPATVNFINASTGPGTLTYNWDFGNGSVATTPNAITIYNKNGTYRVSLFVSSSSGCSDTAVTYIKVGKANTDFKTPVSLCANTPLQFLNNSSPRPIKSFWRFSTGATDTLRNGIASFPGPGTYTATLINSYTACTDSITKSFTILPKGLSDFTANDLGDCKAPFKVNFSPRTPGTSYLWDFGDSTTSTESNPTHTYTQSGDFNVKLIMRGNNGCLDTLQKNAYIKIGKPVISFAGLPTEGCIPYPFTFGANIQTADSVASYKWNFGDGSFSSAKNPSHTYTRAGIYIVSLTITTIAGCTETLVLPSAVKVDTMIKPAFLADLRDACAYPGLQFTNRTPDPRNDLKYLWTFSDGTTSTLVNPNVTFADTGWLDVTLEVNNNGCKNKFTELRYIYLKPSVSKFEFKTDCNNPLQYFFVDKSLGANTWNWEFGDGSSFSGQNPPPHAFPSMGRYKVSLTTTNGSCSYIITNEIIIADNKPDFSARTLEGCKEFTTTFTANISNTGLIKKYVWDYGAGIDSVQGQTAKFTFANSGIYTVSLTAIDSFGCTQSITKKDYIRVHGPSADFTSVNQAGCKGTTTTFFDSSRTDAGYNIESWKWDFGDSTMQTFSSPPFQHTYDSVGDYDVKLVVRDSKGCMDSTTHRSFVKISTIKALISTTGAICNNAPIYFGSETQSDLPYTSFWELGDGSTSIAQGFSHVYADTGYYTVKLKVRDVVGCEDSVSLINGVHVSTPKASFSENNLISYCTPFQAIFTNTSSFYQSSYWDLSIGTSTQQNPSSYYTNKGSYPIKLVVTGPGGCKDSITKVVNVYDPLDGSMNYSPLTGCRPLLVDLQAYSQFNAKYIWDFGDGNVTDTTTYKLRHIYDYPGDFVPKIIIKQPDGCVLTLKGTDIIQVFGAKIIFNFEKNLFCDSGSITIIDSTIIRDSILKYTWDFDDGTISNDKKPLHYYNSPGNYLVSLAVVTEKGCKDTARMPLTVVQSPLIAMATDSVICINERVLHTGIMQRPDTSLVKWAWTFPNGNTSGSQYPTIQQYNTAGKFKITAIATNSSGCADTVVRNLLVNPLPIITLPTTLLKIVGVPLTLPAYYSNNISKYLWNPSNTLSCPDCPQPITTTKFDTWYKVNVVDSNGCQSSAEVHVKVLCEGATIFVPNTFSPNGDGANDVLYVRGKGLERIKSIRIFNRWGEVVYEQREFPVNDALYGWNGKYKGNKAHPDVYIYQVEILCENGQLIRLDGNIALIL